MIFAEVHRTHEAQVRPANGETLPQGSQYTAPRSRRAQQSDYMNQRTPP
jgi:hypothetical protein